MKVAMWTVFLVHLASIQQFRERLVFLLVIPAALVHIPILWALLHVKVVPQAKPRMLSPLPLRPLVSIVRRVSILCRTQLLVKIVPLIRFRLLGKIFV